MPTCVLRYCKNRSVKVGKCDGVPFHRFPRICHEKREEWVKFVQDERREEYWLPSDSSYVCSKHFRAEDMYATKTGRRFLKKTTVPCVRANESATDGTPRSSTPLSNVEVSDSESIFDTPRKIHLKNRLRKVTTLKQNQNIKIKKIQRHNRKLIQKNQSLLELIKTLKNKNQLDLGVEEKLKASAEAVDFYISFMNKKNSGRIFRPKYSPPLRKFALTMYYYSPAAYKYARKTFNNLLPHPRTLSRWYGTINAEPGFTLEAFGALKAKCDVSNKRIICSVIFDEMAIRHQKLWNGKKNIGLVDIGLGSQDGDQVATQALVFMVVSLTENWKIPVGYFFINGITALSKANLIDTCLRKCHDVGVNIVSVTFDGCSANINAANILGCQLTAIKNMQTHFPHPSTGGKVVIFLDPCHMVKLVRNTFESKRLLFDRANQKIKWQLLVNLNRLQENEGLTFANKITARHIYFRNQIMKVKLATQLLSMSVAKALELCENELKSSRFQESSGTVTFITLFNNLFDALNSQKCHYYGYKRPIDAKNKAEIFSLFDDAKNYILSLSFYSKTRRVISRKNSMPRIIINVTKKRLVDSVSKTGFLGLLICIESLKTLYSDLVENSKLLSYISTYRISQDHLELFFGCIRKHGGYNNNPNVMQFKAAYKKILNHLELRSSFTGNCIPLDNFTILHSSSINVINGTSAMYRHDDDLCGQSSTANDLNSDLEAENNCEILSDILNKEQPLTRAAKQIVGYISGFVSRKLVKKIKCERCIETLLSPKKLWFHQLITNKDMGGLCYSSEDVFNICMTTESFIRKLIKESGGKGLPGKYNLDYITAKALGCFINSDVLNCLTEHSFQHPATFNHRLHLIRAIVQKYSNVKLYHAAKTDPSIKYSTNRQKLTKLMLIQGK